MQPPSENHPPPPIHFHPSPNSDLLTEIRTFLRGETDWNQTIFDLALPNATFALVRTPNNRILATASIHTLSARNYWLGNVCVAKSARHQGLASTLVTAVLKHASHNKQRSQIILLASKPGEGVYRRLGFTDIPNVNVSSYVRPARPPPHRSTSAPTLPNEKDLEDAINLEHEVGGQHRGHMLRAIFEKDRLCAVLKSGSSVVAAAWGRYMAPIPLTNVHELHIGPVVAKSPDFAISVIAELLRMDHAANADTRDACIQAAALVVQFGSNEGSKHAFESLGFSKQIAVPYLRKSVLEDDESSGSQLDIAVASEQYYATTFWDVA